MVTAKKKNATVLFLMMFAIMLYFAVPLQVFADTENNQIPDVTIGDNGTVSIDGAGFEKGSSKEAWKEIIGKYRHFIAGISGIAAITMIVIFIFQFMKLGASAGNPQARSQALVGVLWSGIAAAGLGAVTLIVGLFYNAL